MRRLLTTEPPGPEQPARRAHISTSRASPFSFDSDEAALVAAHVLCPQAHSLAGYADVAALVEIRLADVEVAACAGRALGGSLRHNRTLTSLDLSMGEAARTCQLFDRARLDESNAGLPSVLDALIGNQTLRVLRLAGRKGPRIWFARLLALVRGPHRLEELDLENNDLVPPATAVRQQCDELGLGVEIEPFLCLLGTSETLIELNLAMNNLGVDGAASDALANMVKRNQGLRVLRLQNNALFHSRDAARVRFGRLAQALSGHQSLHRLNMSMNQVTLAMGARLGRIVRDLPQLTTLELGGGWGCWWGLDDDEFGHTYLLEFGTCVGAGSSLRFLSIHTNGITSEQLVTISTALKAASALEDLNLGGNIFGHGGVHGLTALAEMVTASKALTGLNLSCNYLHTQHVLAFAQGLADGDGCPLRILDLSSSCVDLASSSFGVTPPISEADVRTTIRGLLVNSSSGVGEGDGGGGEVAHDGPSGRCAALHDPTWDRFAHSMALLAGLGGPLECKLFSIREQLPVPAQEIVACVVRAFAHADLKLVLD